MNKFLGLNLKEQTNVVDLPEMKHANEKNSVIIIRNVHLLEINFFS